MSVMYCIRIENGVQLNFESHTVYFISYQLFRLEIIAGSIYLLLASHKHELRLLELVFDCTAYRIELLVCRVLH